MVGKKRVFIVSEMISVNYQRTWSGSEQAQVIERSAPRCNGLSIPHAALVEQFLKRSAASIQQLNLVGAFGQVHRDRQVSLTRHNDQLLQQVR
jgi:hypothetical protein